MLAFYTLHFYGCSELKKIARKPAVRIETFLGGQFWLNSRGSIGHRVLRSRAIQAWETGNFGASISLCAERCTRSTRLTRKAIFPRTDCLFRSWGNLIK